jgi:ferric-dicitrate binding protein FerR (iron transport regulator)
VNAHLVFEHEFARHLAAVTAAEEAWRQVTAAPTHPAEPTSDPRPARPPRRRADRSASIRRELRDFAVVNGLVISLVALAGAVGATA